MNSNAKLLNFATNEISLEGMKKKTAQQLVEKLMKQIIAHCKSNCSVFLMLYTEMFFCGSFRDDIKICDPDEFDIQLVFSLPKCEIVKDEQFPDHVKVKHVPCKDNVMLHQFLRNKVDGNNFLLCSKMLSWIESKFSKINFDNLVINGYLLNIKIRKNGPALTLCVHVKDTPADFVIESGFKFSIDVVPSLKFGAETWHSERNYQGADRNWFAIFKPKNGAGNAENNLLTPAYPKQDSQIFKNKNHMKSCVRLFKKVRNRKSMGNCKSYFIKTVVMWISERKGVSFWDKPLEHVFYKTLRYAKKCFKNGTLSDYWHPRRNLLDKFRKKQVDSVWMQIDSVIKDFDKNRNLPTLLNLFFTKNELRSILKRIETKRLK